tara:strand:- start:256 stop:504 length:249 start_codon:yes stop_codon:yes gene_type:complete
MNIREWMSNLARDAFERGNHIPHSWIVRFDDGGDGCVQKGFYAFGVQRNGAPCDFPIDHEYGAFESEKDAWKHVEIVKDKLA